MRYLAFLAAWLPAFGQHTVSLSQLRHKMPQEAKPELARSLKAYSRGDIQIAIGHLERVVELDPANLDARHDLAVLYLENGNAGKAAAQFRESTRLQPRSAAAHRDLAYCLLQSGEFASAEAALRESLTLEPSSHLSRYLLALSLMSQGKYNPETAAHLKAAATRFPETRLQLAMVLLQLGQFDEARQSVETYLASPDAQSRELAESWRKLLTIE